MLIYKVLDQIRLILGRLGQFQLCWRLTELCNYLICYNIPPVELIKINLVRPGSVAPAFLRILTWSLRMIQWLWNSIQTLRLQNQASRSALLVSSITFLKIYNFKHPYSPSSHWINWGCGRRQGWGFLTWEKLNGKENNSMWDF